MANKYRKIGTDHEEAILEQFADKGAIPVQTFENGKQYIKANGFTKVNASGPATLSGTNAGVLRNYNDNGKNFGN